MPTYLGWPVYTMPATPAGPASLEAQIVSLVAANTNPFSGQQQTQTWNSQWPEYSVALPPLAYSDAQAWIAFFKSLNGLQGVFQFGSALCVQYPAELTDGASPPNALYFRLKQNTVRYSIGQDRFYRFQFEVRKAF